MDMKVIIFIEIIFIQAVMCFIFFFLWRIERGERRNYRQIVNSFNANSSSNSSSKPSSLELFKKVISEDLEKTGQLLNKISSKQNCNSQNDQMHKALIVRKKFFETELNLINLLSDGHPSWTDVREEFFHFLEELIQTMAGDGGKNQERQVSEPLSIESLAEIKQLLDQGHIRASADVIYQFSALVENSLNLAERNELERVKQTYQDLVEIAGNLNSSNNALLDENKSLKDRLHAQLDAELTPHESDSDDHELLLPYISIDQVTEAHGNSNNAFKELAEQLQVKLQVSEKKCKDAARMVEKLEEEYRLSHDNFQKQLQSLEVNLKKTRIKSSELEVQVRLKNDENLTLKKVIGENYSDDTVSNVIQRGGGQVELFVDTPSINDGYESLDDIKTLKTRIKKMEHIFKESQIHSSKLENTIATKNRMINELKSKMNRQKADSATVLKETSQTFSAMLRDKDAKIRDLRREMDSLSSLISTLKKS